MKRNWEAEESKYTLETANLPASLMNLVEQEAIEVRKNDPGIQTSVLEKPHGLEGAEAKRKNERIRLEGIAVAAYTPMWFPLPYTVR